jgi:hypothetical protein
MNEPTTKENPKTPKRPKRRPAMEPLGWDEIVSQPGMGGYLSFLNGPVPLPHLQGSATGSDPGPGVLSHSGSDHEHIRIESESGPVVVLDPRSDKNPEAFSIPVSITLPSEAIPDLNPYPGATSTPVPAPTPRPTATPDSPYANVPTPAVVSIPEVLTSRLRIRRCAATHDGHSLGEEVLYQALWKAAHPESGETRTIVIGWRGMSQLCRMTPKNCKINTQRLIRKLTLEVLSPYNTPESIGTTYRVYSDQAIMQRRHDAGLEWVVRSRGVDFVDPASGSSIMPICAHTHRLNP